MKPLHGGELGALVEDVFDHNVRSALQSLMKRLCLLAERSSSASLSRMELDKEGRGKGKTLRGVRHTTSVVDIIVRHVPLPIGIQFKTIIDGVYLGRHQPLVRRLDQVDVHELV